MTQLKWNLLHLATYYCRPEMSRLVASNPKGQLLINGLDMNNDSPIHLAAYRKQYSTFLLLAANGAFLDQPNAGGQDPIDALDGNMDMINEIAKLPNLSVANRKRIDKELEKRSKKEQSAVLDKSTPMTPEKNQSALSRSVSPIGESNKTEGHRVYEEVMNNPKAFINSGVKAKEQALQRSASKSNMSELKRQRSTTPNKSNLFPEFELMPPNDEFYADDEIVVTNLMPASGFFYLPKTTAYDMITN